MYVVDSSTPVRGGRLRRAVGAPLPARLLTAIALHHAAVADFDAVAEPPPGERWHRRVHLSATHDVWLIRWGPGSETEMHDHGGSAGVLYIADGTLVERLPTRRPGEKARRRHLARSSYRSMPPAHVHAVRNEAHVVAASVHVYSPPLSTMQHFDMSNGGGLRTTHREVVDPGTLPADDAFTLG